MIRAAPSLEAILPGYVPGSDLERALVAEPELRAGLRWGHPRPGHPEGCVCHHVASILRWIEPAGPRAADLRVLALVHDAFKGAVDTEAAWSRANDHAVLARRFLGRFTGDERLLTAVELHDEPFWLWRTQAGDGALDATLARIPDVALFARFVELDGSTEGKDLTFLWWFRREMALRDLLPRAVSDAPVPLDETGEDVIYVKTYAVTAETQEEVAGAAQLAMSAHAAHMSADGCVLVSDDGARVALEWRWRGPATARLLRDGEVVRRALAEHPVLGDAEALDARLYRVRAPCAGRGAAP